VLSAADTWFKHFDPKTDNFFSISLNSVYEKLEKKQLLFLNLLHAAIVLTARDLPVFITPGSAPLTEFIEAVLICTIRECDPKTLRVNSFPFSASCFQTAEY